MPAIALPPVPPTLLLVPYQSAEWILDRVERGGRVVALTKGHLSLTDLVRAALDKTGPARVTMAVWGAAWEELAKLKALCDAGKITAADAKNVQAAADAGNAAIDLARQLEATDKTGASAKLASAVAIITGVQAYLATKGASK